MSQAHVNVSAVTQALQARDGGPVRCLETHISWVWLTPTHAYKVRKPVDLGFLNFTELSTRLQDCLDELRLNRRTAPTLYEGLIALRGPADAPSLTWVPDEQAVSPGPDVLDYAVCMLRFEAGSRLDELLQAGRLDDRLADELTDTIVDFHGRAEPVSHRHHDGSREVRHVVAENLLQLQGQAGAKAEGGTLARYALWLVQQEAVLRPLMRQREREGAVRDVHGDLHLENICVFDGRVTLFDALEFNADMRRIDVLDDLAFLLMDLRARQAQRLARRVLNRYLEATGDYAGLPLLRYYMAYRAMVRVKVAWLTGGQQDKAALYLALVDEIIGPPPTRGLLITHGLSGSGKTTVSQEVLERIDAVRVRSDVERRRLAQADRYAPASTRLTYEHLARVAEAVVRSGYVAVVDATFLQQSQRDPFHALAQRLGVPFVILHCQAAPDELRARIAARLARGQDASEADAGVLASQEAHQEPLSPEEEAQTWMIEHGRASAQAWSALLARLGAPAQPGTSTLEPGRAGS
ncbi:MAG TPA: AAA family ATPase [Aquabacterium sp.]|uniref:bifunctional aminoglycoside phosphotransferase/ATP-binding protein n=1 Tax=Aquabacterium sp. TaxID=1872578 RepID=UPI002E360EE2|nr:AAA family ATPase [Aquabacterium sp.]HEX5371731.1 AAA family ATPase [Aquabacterium sp.]